MKNKEQKITLVKEDSWVGLYIDGELKGQGDERDEMTMEVLAEALGIPIEEKWADADWLSEQGELPEKITDVKFE